MEECEKFDLKQFHFSCNSCCSQERALEFDNPFKLQYYHLNSLSLLHCDLYVVPCQWEATARLDFLWRLQAQQEVEDMRELREHNECLLHNILPAHVARHFLDRNKNDDVSDSTGGMEATIYQ